MKDLIPKQAKNNGRFYWAQFETFLVADKSDNYRLTAGGYSGTAGNGNVDDLSNGKQFTTRDKDNDNNPNTNCAANTDYGNGGGWWWYESCEGAYVNVPSGGTMFGFGWKGVPGWFIKRSELRLVPKYNMDFSFAEED